MPGLSVRPDCHSNAQREQTLPRCPNELAKRLGNLRRERDLTDLRARHDLRPDTFSTAVPPVSNGLRSPQNAANGTGRGGRTAIKVYEISDNLRPVALDDKQWAQARPAAWRDRGIGGRLGGLVASHDGHSCDRQRPAR